MPRSTACELSPSTVGPSRLGETGNDSGDSNSAGTPSPPITGTPCDARGRPRRGGASRAGGGGAAGGAAGAARGGGRARIGRRRRPRRVAAAGGDHPQRGAAGGGVGEAKGDDAAETEGGDDRDRQED